MDWFRLLIGPDNGSADTLQLSVRAVLLLLFGIACIRIAGRRTFARASPLDIIVAIVVGSNISRIMTGRAAFWPSLAATLVLVVLHRLLAMGSLRWHWIGRLLKGEPAIILRDGRPDRAVMDRHGVTDADLLESLRLKQVERPDQVALATIERGGQISVVPKDKT
jgi:uncharacterized membrane protein YcaP (DUF421 family)